MELHKLLYATIANYELEERLRRDDMTFDAFEYLAGKIGHKNPSTLRKMCEPRTDGNIAKLGLEEAIIIMDVTRDYRLLRYFIARLKADAIMDKRQMDLFAQSNRSFDDVVGEEMK